MKMDITVGRKNTINIGDFSNISPEISITIKDVDANGFDKVYSELNLLSSIMFQNELKTALGEVNRAKPIGKLKSYLKQLDNIDFDNEIVLVKEKLNKLT